MVNFVVLDDQGIGVVSVVYNCVAMAPSVVIAVSIVVSVWASLHGCFKEIVANLVKWISMDIGVIWCLVDDCVESYWGTDDIFRGYSIG